MDKTKIEGLEGEVNDLVKELGGMTDPKCSKLTQLARHACDNHRKIKNSVDNLQESLDYLRICVKYLLFDLEATRRENKYLRKLFEDKNG